MYMPQSRAPLRRRGRIPQAADSNGSVALAAAATSCRGLHKCRHPTDPTHFPSRGVRCPLPRDERGTHLSFGLLRKERRYVDFATVPIHNPTIAINVNLDVIAVATWDHAVRDVIIAKIRKLILVCVQ